MTYWLSQSLYGYNSVTVQASYPILFSDSRLPMEEGNDCLSRTYICAFTN